ncbi:condensation domain-containing protein [Aeromonas dhakensis]|uniref:condensation domain-containing protein n=1 Tax=Aeromonas dhakensis TaxID=196024 RepID=UPI0030823879
MLQFHNEGLLELPVSVHEESCWLLQQQQPEQIIKQAMCWPLPDDIDISLLILSVELLIKERPELNARYFFSADGDLFKYQINGWYPCLEFHRLAADEVDELVRRVQQAPWDSARQPPFKALIINAENSVTLALVLHPVLAEQGSPQTLMAALKQHYDRLATGQAGQTPLLLSSPVHIAEPASCAPAHDVGKNISRIILEEFRRALSSPDMGPDDDFFDNGGHSLLATRIIGKLLSEHGIECRFNDFFESPTAAALARKAVISEQASLQEAVPANNREPAPLALAQASLWRAYEAHDFGTIFNLPFALDFIDEVDESLFARAFADIIERHASLRTLFMTQDGEVRQRILPADQLAGYRWFWGSAESQGMTLAEAAAHRFDLTRELPLRIRFLRDPATGRQQISLLVHHMVVDEWSINLMMGDLAQAYLARAAGSAPRWDAPAPAFHDFARRQAADGINETHLAYWTRLLHGAVPASRRPPLPVMPLQGEAWAARWHEWQPAEGTLARLYELARGHDASLFTLMYTAIALSLHQLGQAEEILIGTSTSGRTDPAFFDSVGYFTTMVAHRVSFAPTTRFGDLLRQVTRTINDSLCYADVPLEQIQQGLGMTPADGLLFDVYIQIHASNALNGRLPTPAGEGLRYRQIDADKTETMFGLQFEIMEDVLDDERRLRLVITYRDGRYSPAQIQTLCALLDRLLEQLVREGTASQLAALAPQV